MSKRQTRCHQKLLKGSICQRRTQSTSDTNLVVGMGQEEVRKESKVGREKSGDRMAKAARMHPVLLPGMSLHQTSLHTPGAGSYHIPQAEGNKRQSSCFKSTLRRMEKVRKSPEPGPGQYNIAKEKSKGVKISTARRKSQTGDNGPSPAAYFKDEIRDRVIKRYKDETGKKSSVFRSTTTRFNQKSHVIHSHSMADFRLVP